MNGVACEYCGNTRGWRCTHCNGLISVFADRHEVVEVTRERDACRREVMDLRELLETERARHHALWLILREVAQMVGLGTVDENQVPEAVRAVVHEREAARARLEAAWQALEAASEVVPRGPAGDTLAEKITALVAILQRVEAERKEALDIIKGDARKLLMEMMGKG